MHVVPHQAQAFASAEGALRSMGFKAREARAMIDAIRGTVSEDATDAHVPHAALYADLTRPLRVSEAIPA